MKNKILHTSAWFILMAMAFSSCQDDIVGQIEPNNADNIINIGVDASGLSVSSSMTPGDYFTRAAGETKPAEEVSWLVQPLKNGLDITYGRVPTVNDPETHEAVAILKLSDETGDGITMKGEGTNIYATNTKSGYAVYSFKYRTGGGNAKWYDNGPHYFEGVHVPNRIRFTAETSEIESDRTNFNGEQSVTKVTDLTKDQSGNVESGDNNQLSNYYLLAHYLGMPANTQISATVSRILLPFRHRLAHVLAYIIIDPAIGANIKGYANINDNDNDDDGNTGNLPQKPFRDNPLNSEIRFCNVDVLEGVKDKITDGVHTLTPTWKEKVRKIVPHFYEEAAEVIVYETDKKKIYPKSIGYDGENGVHTKYTNAYNAAKTAGKSDEDAAKDAKAACGGYEQKKYHAVPVYDLIVRPTYTSKENVMYDERNTHDQPLTDAEKTALVTKKNKIDFQVGLDNGLNYEKEFVFDLDANHETVVYLHISREGVDYNDSGSRLWDDTPCNDGFYGVDNQNGHILSQAGSSWQRAFYNTNLSDDKITDGGFYDEDTPGEDGTSGQYITDATWKKYLLEAHEGGAHHGDYFVLAKDITIDAAELPSDGLVFTGHLDGFTTHPSRGYHKITLQNGGQVVQCSATVTDVLSKLYEDGSATKTVPQLYWMLERAQAPDHGRQIPMGKPIEIDMDNCNPSGITQLTNEGKIILFKDANGEYLLYNNRTFYKKAPSFLFAGLNGIYTTTQETVDNPFAKNAEGTPAVIWEANVHKETQSLNNVSYTYWLPYRDVSGANATYTGWRAEVMNLTVKDGSLFSDGVYIYSDTDDNPKTPDARSGYDVAKVSGNVNNCKEGSIRVLDHTPAMPKYK